MQVCQLWHISIMVNNMVIRVGAVPEWLKQLRYAQGRSQLDQRCARSSGYMRPSAVGVRAYVR